MTPVAKFKKRMGLGTHMEMGRRKNNRTEVKAGPKVQTLPPT